MLAIPEEIKNLIRKDNTSTETRRKVKLTFYNDMVDTPYSYGLPYQDSDQLPVEAWITIENSNMQSDSLIITDTLSASEKLEIGSCEAAKLEIIVTNILVDLTGREFMMTVEIGGYEIPFGAYRVESFIRQSDRRMKKITAYDRMRKFGVDVAEWYQGLTFPISLKSFRDSLCDYVGIRQVETDLPMDDMSISKTIDPQQLDGLSVIRAICEINGRFGHMDRFGQLKYVSLEDSSLFPADDLYPDDDLFPRGLGDGENTEFVTKYKSSETTYEDYLTNYIERVQIRQEEGDIGASYGEGGNCYVVEGNFLVYGKSSSELIQIAAEIYDRIKFILYRPCKIVCPALLWVEPGDGLICYTTDDVIETYCFKRTLKGIQGMADTYEANGSIDTEQNFGIKNQIIQLEGKALILKTSIEELSATMTDLKIDTEAQFKMTAEQIAAEVKRATGTEVELTAAIKINADNILTKVSKGDVSAQISIESGGVSIKGNRFSWESTNSSLTADGTLKCKNGEFSGKVTATSGDIGGFKISGSTLTASSSGTEIRFGDFWLSQYGCTIKNLEIEEEGIYIGSIGNRYSHMWESETGDLYCNELYIDQNWWDGWSLTRTIEELWDYVHGGGWNPCGSDDCGSDCSDSSCGCEEEECHGDDGCCEIECDCSCDNDCADGGCGGDKCDYCSGDCDGAEGPGCV